MTPHALIAPARLAGGRLMRTQSDERLVDLVRAGNAGAFEAIVARYRRPLLRYCEKILAPARAEDAVQQAFLSAYDALREGSGEMNLRPWLYRIAHNTSLNALRDRSLGHAQLDESIDGVERPDQAFERNEQLREVVSAVKDLPERQRNAIVLRELEGRSYEEIALALGVGDGSVRMLLNRARVTVRAGVTALTPFGMLARVPFEAQGDTMAGRVAELTAGAGGALATKAAATLLVTGAVVGGGVAVNETRDAKGAADPPAARADTPGGSAPGHSGALPAGGRAAPAEGPDDRGPRRGRGRGRSGERGEGRRRRGEDGSGGPGSTGGGGSGDDGSRSGRDGGSPSGSGGGDGGSRSGRDGGLAGSGSDDSGSGSSDTSGSGDSGSGSSGSDDAGSAGSGSGSSISGSSGSDVSGSDTSGSGSSGSGRSEDDPLL